MLIHLALPTAEVQEKLVVKGAPYVVEGSVNLCMVGRKSVTIRSQDREQKSEDYWDFNSIMRPIFI